MNYLALTLAQDAQVVKVSEVKSEDKKIKSSSSTQSNKKSQSALLAGAVKRKGYVRGPFGKYVHVALSFISVTD